MDTNGILDGVSVLDLTRVISGPSCTRSLADLGATVFKVEPPDGDLWRTGVPKIDGIAVGFAQLNVGKKFLSIDLSTDKGQALAFDLALKTDVVVENYRPGVAARLGLGFERLAKEKPDIIYCSISGYGQDGPARDRRAYAPIIHAELGLLDQNAKAWGIAPHPESVSHVDFTAGQQACNAVLAGLYRRALTGEGSCFDISMAETMLAMNESTAIEVNGGADQDKSPFHPGKAAIVQVKDGTWAQLPGNPARMIFAVSRALGKRGEMEELGWSEPEKVDPDAARDQLQKWVSEIDDFESLARALDAVRTPVGKVLPVAASLAADWAMERGAFSDVALGQETAKIPTSPMRVKDAYVGPRSGAYALGSDNRAVLSELLGLTGAELDALETDNVLVTERTTS